LPGRDALPYAGGQAVEGAGVEIDRAAVEAEIRAAFDAYEAALVGNDVEALIGFFWNDPRAVRLGADGGLWGFDAIAAFRRVRDAQDVGRTLARVEIVALSPEIGVANALYRRTGSGRDGAQSQVWLRTQEGWRIASAHVSLAP
jgi:ketosteroid isomerase-like protein